MAFQNVEPKVWKPEKENDEVIGFFISKKDKAGSYESPLYQLESPGGKRHAIFANVVLDDKMAFCKHGDLIKIVYKGKKKSDKNQDYKDFDVYIDDGEKPVIS